MGNDPMSIEDRLGRIPNRLGRIAKRRMVIDTLKEAHDCADKVSSIVDGYQSIVYVKDTGTELSCRYRDMLRAKDTEIGNLREALNFFYELHLKFEDVETDDDLDD
jgi:hypothetical protein